VQVPGLVALVRLGQVAVHEPVIAVDDVHAALAAVAVRQRKLKAQRSLRQLPADVRGRRPPAGKCLDELRQDAVPPFRPLAVPHDQFADHDDAATAGAEQQSVLDLIRQQPLRYYGIRFAA
jgi:hypothetical protein